MSYDKILDTANSVFIALNETSDMVQTDLRTPKPKNTRTKKTAWKERRRLANAPRSIQKRVLRRV